MSGYVYALYNPSLRREGEHLLIKVGMTTNDPWSRAKELSTTGVPEPYQVVWYHEVVNPIWYEKQLHEYLAPARYRKNREFFVLTQDYLKEQLPLLSNEIDEKWETAELMGDIDDDDEAYALFYQRLLGSNT
jgi:hypothetical protein